MAATASSSWKELDGYVSKLIQVFPNLQIWKDIERKPITVSSIDHLISDSTNLIEDSTITVFTGGIVIEEETKKMVILLKAGLDSYNRDVTLFHELAHLHHPIYLSRRSNEFDGFVSYAEETAREAITEWLGRKARADPELLRHAVLSFGLEAQVYDKSSYQAFQKIIKSQQCFPFMEQEYPVLMD